MECWNSWNKLQICYNNFTKANSTDIGALFSLYKNAIVDFHNDSDTTNNRCANQAGVIDGNSDDQEGLIEFIEVKTISIMMVIVT